jgi:hypothetical protein
MADLEVPGGGPERPLDAAPGPREPYRAVLHLHTDRSRSWSYPPLERFAIPDCYAPFTDRLEEHAASGVDLIAITDHDTPFVMDDADRRRLDACRARCRQLPVVISGEEVTVRARSVSPGDPTAGAHVLILYRGLDPYRDRKRILAIHAEVHRHNHDVFELFRFLRQRDDLIDILAHPFAGPLRLNGHTLHRLASEGWLRRIEAFSGGEATAEQNRFATALARAYGLGVTSSDDRHRRGGRPRNCTLSPATTPDGFLDDLWHGRTVATSIHAPTYPRKCAEVLDGFYFGYLPWLVRRLLRRTGEEPSPGTPLQLAATAVATAVWVPAALAGVAIYLWRGELRSRADFATLAALEPRLLQAPEVEAGGCSSRNLLVSALHTARAPARGGGRGGG